MTQRNNLYFDLNRATIDLIVRVWREGQHEELKQLGIPVEIAALLARMRTSSYMDLINFRGSIINFTSDNNRLVLMIKHMEQKSLRDEQVNKMIQMGAPQPLLYDIATVDRAEFQCRRKILGVASGSGKPRNLSKSETLKVLDTLQQITTPDPLVGWLTLGESTGISLTPVWYFLKPNNPSKYCNPWGGKSDADK
ncbi:MAG: DUF2857 domain-containing protein [Gammaproteobacteria bacterium]|nr:DUF2857 domain-containing protein [Gammaproteobacteria bacterium]